ncbi:hypothetical protein FIBSPDRAFT_886340 [Athelia psychrophila]|uniref:Uncharacterized protein n=1 Tax=Athelia psychrophila TaxID=1759441 RepID=A0A166R1C2_9AGAM|nr:hypothetical protein FIBSPDRAFT_886340 [Fibularhizoctonia sp. CBS 109695]
MTAAGGNPDRRTSEGTEVKPKYIQLISRFRLAKDVNDNAERQILVTRHVGRTATGQGGFLPVGRTRWGEILGTRCICLENLDVHELHIMAPSKRSSGKRCLSPTDAASEPKPKRVATSKPSTKKAPKKAALKNSAPKRGAAVKIPSPEPRVDIDGESDHEAGVAAESAVESVQSPSTVNEPLEPGLFHLYAQGLEQY